MSAPGRVLVADDERFFRELYSEALLAKGHHVRTAASGEEALRLLGADRFDLLLSDLAMPGMDGVQLVREARACDPQLEAIAVTADDQVRTVVQAMKVGCADFLVKPVDREELGAAVDRALARSRIRREHEQLLGDHVELGQAQALFRQCLAIVATLDLERLQDLIMAVLSRATDSQGAAIWVAEEKGELALLGYRGVVDRSGLAPRIDPRAAGIGAEVRQGRPFAAPGTRPGEAFYVPLVADEEPVGLVLLTDRSRGRFGPAEHAAALAVADAAAVALRNARRFQALERTGLRDRDSAAYNLAYFVDYAGKEFYKSRRYGRQFSLVVLAVDNFEQMRKAAGRELFRSLGRDLVAAMSRGARDADILAKVSDNEYYALLPETDYFGALMFQRRVAEEVRDEDSVRALEERCPVLLAMGAATFPKDGQDFDELLHFCRARAEEQRGSLVRRMHLGDLEPTAFWDLCDLLLTGSWQLPDSSPSARRLADPELFAAAQREAAREIGRDPHARGVLYLGLPGGMAGAPILGVLPSEGMARADDSAARVYLLGPRNGGETRLGHPLVTQVFLDGDPRISGHEFLLFLGENSAYGLVARPGGTLFHTCDAPLVDALISKLQALYDLQPL